MTRTSTIWVSLLFLASCASGDPSADVLSARDGIDPGTDEFFWNTEHALADGVVGEWTNLLLPGDDLSLVAHMEVSTPYRAHLSRKNSGVWTDQVIGVSGRLSSIGLGLRAGNPVLAYFDGTDLRYFENGQAASVDSTGETGDWPSLVVNGSGRVMISYQRCFFDRDLCNDTTSEIRRELRFAYSDDGTVWQNETVEVGTATSNSGFYTTIAILDGNPIISYFNRTQSLIKIAKHQGGAFGNTSAWKVVNVAVARGGDSRPAMAVGPAGIVGISFCDPSAKDLYYTESKDAGLTWSVPELVDRLGDLGSYSDIAFDASGQVAIVYYDGTDRGEGEGLKIAWKKGDTWITRSIVRGAQLGQFPSIQFGADGKPVASFFDGLAGDLMYSSYAGPSWPPDLQP
jgi:hypothetical protein